MEGKRGEEGRNRRGRRQGMRDSNRWKRERKRPRRERRGFGAGTSSGGREED